MKKLTTSLILILLILVMCFTAMAENRTTTTELYDSMTRLLFYKDNVTLNGTAKFSLDGVWLKTAEITLQQDGNRSFRKLSLSGPKRDGTVQKNGYTIITDDTTLYLMEEYYPGIYRTGGTAAHTSLIRRSRETEQLISLGRAMIAHADLFAGENPLTEMPEGDIRFEIKENVPDLFNAVLNQAFQFAARRYFDNEYDSYSMDGMATVRDYATVSQGILYTAQSMSLKQALLTMKRDENGMPKYLEGEIALIMETAAEGTRQINVSFQMNVKDLEKTKVKRFDPADYNVVSEYEMIGSETMFIDEQDLNEIEIAALDALILAGFDRNSIVYMEYQSAEDGGGEVSFGGMEGWEETIRIAGNCKVTAMDMDSAEWKNGSDDQFIKDPQPDAETDEKVKAFLKKFLQEVNPEAVNTADSLKPEWVYKRYDHAYAKYTGENQAEFVVRIEPEMRAESVSLPRQ